MIPVCRAATTRALDASVIRGLGMPGALLMELAGRGVADLIAQRHARGVVAVLCGPGNNGGDGYVIARWLHLWGWTIRLWSAGPPRTPDAALNADLCARMGLAPMALEPALDGATLAVDALLGTGQSAPLRGVLAAAAEALLARPHLPVVAVDLPTGMDADRGTSVGRCVRATWTATLGRWKPGLLTAAGRLNSGPVSLIDIGLDLGRLHHGELDLPDAWLLEDSDVRGWLPLRSPTQAKWDRGHVAVRGGGGAAILTAHAALRGGAGLVSLLVPRADWSRLHGLWPSIILAEPDALDPNRHDVLVIGPGLGLDPTAQAEALARWSDWPGALVADADALTALSGAALRGSSPPTRQRPRAFWGPPATRSTPIAWTPRSAWGAGGRAC
jgi:ADP-dependent NAD(P)H-hydrate dehydratase / NAD(P)H-hydrate epimerase